MAICTIDGCAARVNARGLCHRHYKRWQMHGDPLTSLNPRMDGVSVSEKLKAYSDRSGGAEACWLWTRGLSSDGYGRIYLPGARRATQAHRAAYEDAVGPIPPGKEVLHQCDTPACINPRHLRVGSHAENMAEMSARDRASRGQGNPRTKLTDEQVAEARRLAASGVPQKEIAALMQVSQPFMSRLVRGERR